MNRLTDQCVDYSMTEIKAQADHSVCSLAAFPYAHQFTNIFFQPND